MLAAVTSLADLAPKIQLRTSHKLLHFFGGLNSTNNQQKTSLFSTQPQQPASSTLFGGTGTQQQGGSLFGGSMNSNQQQQQSEPNSLFGNSLLGNSQQNQQTPQSFTASIGDSTAFGTPSLFAGLQAGPVHNPGPLATPLSSSIQKKKGVPLPMYKLNPASSSRLSTPVKRGFGFSYSNFGTPGSASSTSSTPGGNNLNNGLLGGSLGRGLIKSVSTNSLRRSFNTEDSILAPGAFSASPSSRNYGSTGSMKKLVITKGIRGDLFLPPPLNLKLR